MITSILVANRGEIARRIFHTCRSLGIETVAVFSDADANAPFVADADRAVGLPGNAPADTYLRGDLLISAAKAAGADAIHPGYGFLAENADFARAVGAAGLIWIGPSPDTIDAMGSKIRAKELMAAAGVPILSVDAATATAADFPLLVKASAGGGGRGMRVVDNPENLAGEMIAAEAEAASTFGDGTVFVEPYLPTARHIEVQVMADSRGNCWVLGDRDCSIQRRHQKVVEEAPAPLVSEQVRKVLHEAARAAVDAVGYLGAGTVEFLVADAHLETGKVYFLEMNTRLQVEHPVTECVTGLDLVELQIAVAEGDELEGDAPAPRGHAVEVRLYAEDPADNWQPQTGTVRTFDLEGVAFTNPDSYGIRIDSAVETGSEVGIHYDAMLAKVIAYGRNRDSAIRSLRGALKRLNIHGVTTNTDMLLGILADDEFHAGRVHTALLDERLEEWTVPSVDELALRRYALAAALSQARQATAQAKVLGRVPTAFRNVPSQPRTRTYRRGDAEFTVSYANDRGHLVSSEIEGVRVLDSSPAEVKLDSNGVVETYTVAIGDHIDLDGPLGSVSFTPVTAFIDPAEAVAEGSLLAPMPAAVISVNVENGQHVTKGDIVVVLEAMKMQHTITAPVSGVVSEISVTPGTQVESGAVLAVIANEGETA
ncbi:MAG: ATP-binding protein [Aeromicrobium sp.]